MIVVQAAPIHADRRTDAEGRTDGHKANKRILRP